VTSRRLTYAVTKVIPFDGISLLRRQKIRFNCSYAYCSNNCNFPATLSKQSELHLLAHSNTSRLEKLKLNYRTIHTETRTAINADGTVSIYPIDQEAEEC
jgi:hypothetical protein